MEVQKASKVLKSLKPSYKKCNQSEFRRSYKIYSTYFILKPFPLLPRVQPTPTVLTSWLTAVASLENFREGSTLANRYCSQTLKLTRVVNSSHTGNSPVNIDLGNRNFFVIVIIIMFPNFIFKCIFCFRQFMFGISSSIK